MERKRINVAYYIREIQKSDLGPFDKVLEVKKVFAPLFQKQPENAEILHAVENTVCDNIGNFSNLVPMALPYGYAADEANLITYKLGFYIGQGGSGTVYLSWNSSMEERDIENMCTRLYDAGHEGLICEEFDRLNRLFPDNHLQLLFASGEDAKAIAEFMEKNAYTVFKDAIYLLSI